MIPQNVREIAAELECEVPEFVKPSEVTEIIEWLIDVAIAIILWLSPVICSTSSPLSRATTSSTTPLSMSDRLNEPPSVILTWPSQPLTMSFSNFGLLYLSRYIRFERLMAFLKTNFAKMSLPDAMAAPARAAGAATITHKSLTRRCAPVRAAHSRMLRAS